MAFLVGNISKVAANFLRDVNRLVVDIDQSAAGIEKRVAALMETPSVSDTGEGQTPSELSDQNFVILTGTAPSESSSDVTPPSTPRSGSEDKLETPQRIQSGSFAECDESTVVPAASPQAVISKQRPTIYEIYQVLQKDPRVDMFEFLKNKNTQAIDTTPIEVLQALANKYSKAKQIPKEAQSSLTPEGQAVIDGLKTAAGKVAATFDSILSNIRG